ncbi:MAG: hypothetical protein ACOYVK_05245 [Bacillota bacterium]
MESLKIYPYIFVFVSILISTIIGMIQKISFVLFLKRSLLFIVIIYTASKVFFDTIGSIKKKSTESTFNMVIPAEMMITTDDQEENPDEDDFTPLEFNDLQTISSSKSMKDRNNS